MASEPQHRHAEGSPERRLLDALDEPRTLDAVAETVCMDASETRRLVTMLELSGEIKRSGSKIARA